MKGTRAICITGIVMIPRQGMMDAKLSDRTAKPAAIMTIMIGRSHRQRMLGVMRGVWISRINVTSIPTTPIAARLMTGAAWEKLCSKRPIQIGIGARFANRMQATMHHILAQAKVMRLITTQDLLAPISQIFPTV